MLIFAPFKNTIEMNKLIKTVLVALTLLVIPSRYDAQTVKNNRIEIEIAEISNPDLRYCILSALAKDDNLIYSVDEDNNSVIVTSSNEWSDSQLQIYYDRMRTSIENEFTAYQTADKETQGETFTVWKESLPQDLFVLLFRQMLIENAEYSRENQTCATSDPFCTTDVVTFHIDANPGTVCESGPNYGCMSSYTQRPPFWFHMKIAVAGTFTIRITNSNNNDLDFCAWGPFTDPHAPCPNQLTADKIIDCDSPYNSVQECTIPSNSQVGQYYIMVITKYSSGATDVTFSKVANSGPGETDCGILPGIANNDGPYCVGQTIHLTVNAQDGATYSWTGPGGFTSSLQNPTRPNCTLNMAGTYTCVTTVGNQTTSATTEVVIYPQPTANFTFTNVCVGEATQFTSNCSTNPPGQQINSYQWNFGDGQTSTMNSPSHTYASPGTYQVTLTVGCGNGLCTSEITKAVTVSALPTVSFDATTVCQGSPTQFTGQVTGGQNITNYQWNFGDGQTGTGQSTSHTYAQAGTYQVTLTATSASGSCPGEVTQTVTVIALPAADAGPDQTIPYGSTTQLSGSGGAGTFNFHWEPANMVTNPNAQNTQTVVLTEDQTYTLTVTNPQGNCTETDEVTIHISGNAMTVTANAFPGSICEGESTQLEANAGGGTGNFTYSWTPTTGLSNPNIYNPIATPTQTTTYTCTVGDGQTTQNVNVTVTVNYPEFEEEHYYICPNETYIWNGLTCSAEGDYEYHTTTAQGCEKTITLHLHHYPTYDETTINEYICSGDSYNFFGTNYTVSGQYSHMLQSVHGCDSIVRLNLTVWPENDVTIRDVSLCPEQLPYNFYGVDYYSATDVTVWDTDIHGCDSAVRLVLSINDYYIPPTDVVYSCDESYTWNPVGNYQFTFTETGFYIDTLPTSACDGIFKLDLHFQQVPDVIVEEVVTCDSYTWPMTLQTFTQSGTYYHSVPLTPYPCEQLYQLNLTINTQSLLPDMHVRDSCDHAHIPWFEQDTTFTANTVYTFKGETDEGCYREQTYYIENMKYTPNPSKIQCSDNSAVVFGDTIAVVTNTEFFSFQYSFFVEEDKRECVWDQCTWEISKPSWAIEFNPVPQTSSEGKSYGQCTVFVADRQNEFVVLTATISNDCGTKERKFYLKSSFLDVEENEINPANVTIIPNPNSGKMQLDFENMEGRTAVKVFDMTGNQIDAFETTINTSHYSYDYNMKRYAEGIYFFVIANDNRVFTKKVVIIH